MDFTWTEEQTSMRAQAYKFGKEVVAPRSAEMDEKEELDWDAWKQAAEFGFQGMVVPQKYGGLDLDPLTICITMEGLGHGSRDVGFVTSGTFSPTFKKPLAMALVEAAVTTGELAVDIRGKAVAGRIVSFPFLSARTKGDPRAARTLS